LMDSRSDSLSEVKDGPGRQFTSGYGSWPGSKYAACRGKSAIPVRRQNRLVRTVGTTGADYLTDSLRKSGPRASNTRLSVPSAPAETISV